MPVAAPDSAGWDSHGPYVDKVIFRVIEDLGQQKAALLAGELDHIAENVRVEYVRELQNDSEVAVKPSPSLNFDFMAINCQRYPYSIPAFRRALAFAADKYDVASIMWQSLGFAIDTPVPASCGVWHNNATTPDYKESNGLAACAELAAAGFVDIDADGWVEAPNGDDFVFRVLYPNASSNWEAALVSQRVRWEQVGIQVELSNVSATDLWNSVMAIPRDYDGACLSMDTEVIPWHLTRFTTGQIPNPEGNFLNWGNSSYDVCIDVFASSSDYDEVANACRVAQEVFVQEVPMMVLCTHWEVNAYRINRYEGFVITPSLGTGPRNHWTLRKVRLLSGDPERDPVKGVGGTFTTCLTFPMASQNPLTAKSVYDQFVLSQVYDSLVGETDPSSRVMSTDSGVAFNWTVEELPNNLKLTFHLVNNASWQDSGGNYSGRVTAYDVEFTYNYIHAYNISTFSPGLQAFNSCHAIDPYTLELVIQGRSYLNLYHLLDWPILPKHIWQSIDSPTTYPNANPVGCGPFQWVNRLDNVSVELHRWEEYHYGIHWPLQWLQPPVDQAAEYGTDFRLKLNASADVGLDQWWLNDTSRFQTSGAGVITNSSVLAVGIYGLRVRVNDTSGNVLTADFSVTIADTTLPTWRVLPTDQVLLPGQALDYQLEAWDLSGIDEWVINDTTHFSISTSGRLTSFGELAPGRYGLSVTVSDPYDNQRTAVFSITVQEQPPPPGIPGFPFEAVLLGVAVALGFTLRLHRLEKKPTTRTPNLRA